MTQLSFDVSGIALRSREEPKTQVKELSLLPFPTAAHLTCLLTVLVTFIYPLISALQRRFTWSFGNAKKSRFSSDETSSTLRRKRSVNIGKVNNHSLWLCCWNCKMCWNVFEICLPLTDKVNRWRGLCYCVVRLPAGLLQNKRVFCSNFAQMRGPSRK